MHLVRPLCAALSLLLAAGCASLPWSRPGADLQSSSGKPAAISLGEPILLAGPRSRLLKAVVDAQQAVHVLLWSQPEDRLRHRVVSDGQLREAEPVPAASSSAERLDAVVDAGGVLHAIVDNRLFALGAAGWEELENPGCRRFVRGGPNVACLFELSAPDPRNRKRWDWFGFGGLGAGIVWPWPSLVTKFGIAEHTASGWLERGIVDRASNLSLAYADAVASRDGDIEVVYRRRRFMLAEDSQLRYERFNAPGHPAAPLPARRIAPRGAGDASWSLLGITLEELVSLTATTAPEPFWSNPRIAADPRGRESLVLASDNAGGIWVRRIVGGLPEPARLLLDGKGHRRLTGVATLENGRVIVLVEETRVGWWSPPPQPLRLMEYRDGQWSTPIAVGATATLDSSSLLAIGSDSVGVFGVDQDGRPWLRRIRLLD